METRTGTRRYDLDWLRVLAILTIFIYHTMRFFNSESWHIKNPTTYFVMDVLETILANWIMALIFTVSGASLFYALGKGGVGKFIKDKVLRLVVPLVTMGMIIFGALQIYLDRLSHGEFGGSLFEFIPQYFQPDNFAWTGVHLWYLEMLFIFCLIFLPLFLWLKRGSGQRVLGRLGDLLASPGALYLLALPTILCLVLTDSESFLGNTAEWGGGSILTHATFFVSGFLIISHEGLQKNIQRFRWLSLVLVVVLLITLFGLMTAIGEPPSGSLLAALGRALWGLWSWSWVLAILGFGTKHLNFNRPFLSYANEAVLPFYILHHPVLLSVGYFIVRWAIPDAVKFVAIDVISFVIIMVLYEFVVRRFNAIRFLFGVKLLVRTPVAHTQEAQAA
ncbi:MAG: acyltransferase family protein [Anaerolineae bacterium]|jgi:glucan biosynthesis protein C